TACISITADAERLACYDAQAQAQRAAAPAPAPAPAPQAENAGDGDGNGFSLGGLASALSPFGGGEDSGSDTNLVTSSLRGAREFVPGRYRFTLENGQVWEQTTSADRLFLPANAAGLPVEIVTAPLGGYFMRIGDRRGVRV